MRSTDLYDQASDSACGKMFQDIWLHHRKNDPFESDQILAAETIQRTSDGFTRSGGHGRNFLMREWQRHPLRALEG